MPIDDLPSCAIAVRSAFFARRVPHAWLFFGPPGAGLEDAGRTVAQALVCGVEPMRGCGSCATCRRVVEGNHPDVVWIMSEIEQLRRGTVRKSEVQGAASRDIRIEQIRKLIERLALRPLEGANKVAIIVGADAMNPPAQNALLKQLEEPPPNSVLVLTTSAPDTLLPTIRSRCIPISFPPSGDAVDAEPSGWADAFDALKPGQPAGWLALAERAATDRQRAVEFLGALEAHLRVRAASTASDFAVFRTADLVAQARNAIVNRNGAPRLQLERLFIEIFALS